MINSSPSLTRTPFYQIILSLFKVSFGEREHHMHSQYMYLAPWICVLSRGVSYTRKCTKMKPPFPLVTHSSHIRVGLWWKNTQITGDKSQALPWFPHLYPCICPQNIRNTYTEVNIAVLNYHSVVPASHTEACSVMVFFLLVHIYFLDLYGTVGWSSKSSRSWPSLKQICNYIHY